MAKTIALLTDFGQRDNFAGVMKGVILSFVPQAKIVDITHEVPSWDIKSGAFLLWRSFSFFPPSTVFLAVIDPGVGSRRKALIVKTKHYYFVGPDNGLLSWAAKADGIVSVFSARNSKYFLPQISHTFHGRDIFAPLAASVAKGVPLSRLGKREKEMKIWEFPQPSFRASGIKAQVLYVDKFGNLVLNLKCSQLPAQKKLYLKTKKIRKKLSRKYFYQEAEEKEFLILEGGFGFCEIALNKKSAAAALGLKTGDKIEITTA